MTEDQFKQTKSLVQHFRSAVFTKEQAQYLIAIIQGRARDIEPDYVPVYDSAANDGEGADLIRISRDIARRCVKASVCFTGEEIREPDERAFRKIVSARLQTLGDEVMAGWRKTFK